METIEKVAMDDSPTLRLDSKISERKSQAKRRKVVEKTVVKVKIGENDEKLKNEGPPSDFWSWRKYGQKPIKGSPYPRGYYRCSTSKGCSAKKQVEICRTDASMLIITYTSSHNHPGPDILSNNTTQLLEELPREPVEPQSKPTEAFQCSPTPKQEQPQEPEEEEEEEEEEDKEKQNQPITTTSDENASEDHSFHYLQSPIINCSGDIMISQEDPFTDNSERANGSWGILLDAEPMIPCHGLVTFSTCTPKSEENDFFDELEELPTSSSLISSARDRFFDERIPAVPS